MHICKNLVSNGIVEGEIKSFWMVCILLKWKYIRLTLVLAKFIS